MLLHGNSIPIQAMSFLFNRTLLIISFEFIFDFNVPIFNPASTMSLYISSVLFCPSSCIYMFQIKFDIIPIDTVNIISSIAKIKIKNKFKRYN